MFIRENSEVYMYVHVFFCFFFVYIMQKQTIANSGVPV